MRSIAALFSLFCTLHVLAQGPTVTSWILNPGGETGYGGNPTNVQSVAYTATDVYVTSTCIPGYDIGPWTANPNLPANQDFTFKITRNPVENNGTLVNTPLGHIGVWRNGVSIFNAKDGMSYNNQGIWNRDALIFEGISFDDCLGHAAPNGEYHHHVSPNCLYPHLAMTVHSPLIGYAFDGFPIYGAHGYTNADGTGGISRMRTSYRLRNITERTTLANGTTLPANQYGPALGGQYPLGAFLEDHEFVNGLGDLDEHNGRYCVTPEYPEGTYAYFVTLSEGYEPEFPYVLGPTYHGTVQPGNTGPQSGHNSVPGNATPYTNNPAGLVHLSASSLLLHPVPCDDVLNIQNDHVALTYVEILAAQDRSRNYTTSMVRGALWTWPPYHRAPTSPVLWPKVAPWSSVHSYTADRLLRMCYPWSQIPSTVRSTARIPSGQQ